MYALHTAAKFGSTETISRDAKTSCPGEAWTRYCTFDWTQEVWCKTQAVGLSPQCVDDAETHTFRRHLLALSLPPVNVIIDFKR